MLTRIQRWQFWQLALLAVMVFGSALAWLQWRQSAGLLVDARTLLAALPGGDATTLYIDAATLRRSGILDLIAGSKAAEEPDYRAFVEQTAFDYRRDLDAVAASFNKDGSFFALEGQFQWQRLSAYANAQGGECRQAVCNVPGEGGGRNISFFPISSRVLALAVSPGPWGVMSIAAGRTSVSASLPREPAWISAPAATAAQIEHLPLLAGVVLAPLAKAETITLSFGAKGADLQMRVEARCSSPEAAATSVGQLSAALAGLRQAIAKKKAQARNAAASQPGLSDVLAQGAWEQRESRVTGTWLLERRFVEAFAAGQLE